VVITDGRWRADVERGTREQAGAAPDYRFTSVSDARPMLGSRLAEMAEYSRWQRRAARLAQSLDDERPFDVVHHLGYSSLLGGTQLWRLDRPLVFGPVGGGQTSPRGMRPAFGDAWRQEALRNVVVRRLWWTFPAARRAVRRGLVVVCNDETEALARRLGARAVVRDVDVGLPAERFVEPTFCRPEERPLRLIWVGRLFPRKAVDLAVETVAAARHPVTLDVVGDGPRMPALRALVEKLGLCERVTVHGMVPVDDVAPLLRGADVLVFTSARDTTGLQLLEGMALGLPVVCLDHQGARRLVTDAAGIRVPIGGWEDMARDMAAAVDRLADDPELRRRMGRAAHERSLREEWGRKAERTIGWYEAALAGRRSPS